MALENTTIYILIGYIIVYVLFRKNKDLFIIGDIMFIILAMLMISYGLNTEEKGVGFVALLCSVILILYDFFFRKVKSSNMRMRTK